MTTDERRDGGLTNKAARRHAAAHDAETGTTARRWGVSRREWGQQWFRRGRAPGRRSGRDGGKATAPWCSKYSEAAVSTSEGRA
eukprot:CAMPEP_0197602988 /NCGR_PEP_ID=MMETSP1326-20131121/38307_1 /TAXON_ID=1155430 /ORGANISM="Genus nov. species nov., Strain RCC2288" /LENGTH=83 /DNA_ID=CAMNT_0043170435 /DNA_START=135 /DNA_END=384 /DNA_ORIENTATION=+